MLGVRNQPGWWVTIAEKDLDGWNALALAKSLRLALTTRELCILVGERVSDEMKALLTESYDYLVEVSTEGAEAANISPAGLLTLSAWKCCTKRAIFVHPCSLVLKNCDELFAIQEDFATIPIQNCNRKGKGCQLNTHFFVFRPNLIKFKNILKDLDNLNNNNNLASAHDALNSYFKKQWNAIDKEREKENTKIGQNIKISKLGQEYNLVIGKEFDRNCFNSDTKIIRFETETPWKMGSDQILESWTGIYRQTVADLPRRLLDDDLAQRYRELCFDDHDSRQVEHIFSTTEVGTTPASQTLQENGLGEAIAVIGMSCRFPGANNEDEFWELLIEGRDETRPLPPERFFTKPDLENEHATPAGYMKCAIEDFDAKFFEISPREAEYMDPQQRLLLEVTWEALEQSGLNPASLHGTTAAVFVGLWAQEYAMHITNEARNGRDFQHKYLGNALCASAARIAHCLGLRGPAVAHEAGCASALEGLHYAIEALRSRETDLALACGVNIALGFSGELSSLDSFLLSRDGKCKTFDESANGFARGEACVTLVLKRVADALRDGDHVLGILRGSALNNDGAGSALGTPNAAAQEEVLLTALRIAGVEPHDVSYIEAHGTGTPIGDPIEFHALNQVFGGSEERVAPLYVGSVKTNIGHTEGASGMAGLVKVLLAMRHSTIPKHLHFKTLNPYIKLDEIPAVVPLENTPWPPCSARFGRVAGVSSFGLSGTNVHVIVQETPHALQQRQGYEGSGEAHAQMERPAHLLALSAKTEPALQQLVIAYTELLERADSNLPPLEDIAFTANTGRAHFRHRLAVIAKDNAQLLTRLRKGYHVAGKVAGKEKPRVAFLFTGQGSQYVAMGKTLYQTHPIFKSTFEKCAKLLHEQHGLNLHQILGYGVKETGGRIDESVHSQPAIFCIEICLAELWASFGITPEVVLGHSVGEFAASVVAGILSLEEGLALVVGRSKLVHSLERGAMMVVKASLDTVRKLITDFEASLTSNGGKEDWVDIAAINSPVEVVVSGPCGAIAEFEGFIQKHSQGVGTQRLAASHAFHSRDMELVIPQYREIVERAVTHGHSKRIQQCRYMSGTLAREMELVNGDFTTEYWLRHLRDPVNFAEAFSALFENEGGNESGGTDAQDEKVRRNTRVGAFVEIGAQPVLLGLGMGCAPPEAATACVWCPSLRKTEENWTTLLTSVSRLYVAGVDVNWTGFDAPYAPRRVRLPARVLPTYPWQHEKFWYRGRGGVNGAGRESLTINAKLAHPILGRRIPSPLTDTVAYYSSLSLESLPYMKDHRVAERVILPAAGYLEAVLAAGRDILCGGGGGGVTQIPLALENLTVESALPLREEQCTQLQTVLSARTESEGALQYEVRVYRQTVFDPSGSDSGKWKKLVSASFVPGGAGARPESVDIEAMKEALTLRDAGVDDIYEKIAEMGITFGPAFKSIQQIWYSDSEFLVETSLPEGAERYVCHPVVLDAMIQSCVASLAMQQQQEHAAAGSAKAAGLYLPMMIKKCVVYSSALAGGASAGAKLYIHSRRGGSDEDTIATGVGGLLSSSAVRLYSASGAPLALVDGIDLVQTTVPSFLRLIASDGDEYPGFFEEIWQSAGPGPRGARLPPLNPSSHPDLEKYDEYRAVMQRVEAHAELMTPVGPKLDALCYAYVQRALVLLGWNYAPGQEVALSVFCKTSGVLARHTQLVGRWIEILAEEGDVLFEPTYEMHDWLLVERSLPSLDELESRIAELGAWFTTNYDEVEYKFIVHCGEALPEVLRGHTSPFAVLFPEGSGAVGAAEMYRNSTLKFLHKVGAQLVRAQVHTMLERTETKTPRDYVYRILEVGAGTGAQTEALQVELDLLGVPYEYTVTDVSPLLLNEARKRFTDKQNFKFRLLDIEIEPKSQGFDPHYFDCILADNVMHATRRLSETLANLRHLLVPGGTFVFTELVAPLRIVDVSFGLLDAWWRFEDRDVRPRYPTVSTDTWFRLLEAAGFENAREYAKYEGFDYRNIVAFASPVCQTLPSILNSAGIPVHSDAKPTGGVWLIFGASEDKYSDVLEGKLRLVGKQVLHAHSATESEKSAKEGTHTVNPIIPTDFSALFEELNRTHGPGAIEGILYLWGIDKVFNHQESADGPEYNSHLRATCGGLLHLVQALHVLESKPKLAVVTCGAQHVDINNGTTTTTLCAQESTNPISATLWGILLTFLNEFADRHAAVIDVDPDEASGAGGVDRVCEDVFHQMWLIGHEPEHQIAFRANRKFVRRLVNSEPFRPPLIYPNAERFRVEKPPNGTIPDISIVAAVHQPLTTGQVEVRVHASALNFKDVLIAMSTSDQLISATSDSAGVSSAGGTEGTTPPKFATELGVDFSGVVTATSTFKGVDPKFKVGDRVFGFIAGGALASHVVAPEACVHPLPEGMSFEEGSTLPCVYLTAIYFLLHIGRLSADDRVLIHVASGGVGLAAIAVARAVGAQVFATAGSRRKRNFLVSQAGVPRTHVYNSRSTAYGDQIQAATEGAGVTVVLNALTGPGFKETSLGILADGGRFLEMSKLNVWSEEEVKELRPDVRYFIQRLNNGNGEQNEGAGGALLGAFGDADEFAHCCRLLLDGLHSGAYKPLPCTLFPLSRVQDAFRYLQEARHIGKVVVRLPSVSFVGGRVEHREHLFNEYSTYLITGGLGGLGLEVAKWMASTGAKFLCLVGRSPPSGRAEAILSTLRQSGTSVLVLSADVSSLKACRCVFDRLADEATGFPPLRGIFHAAGVLADGLIINQTLDPFMSVYGPKVAGTNNLHRLTLERGLTLDHFVLFSSVVSALGGIGQPNHASANKYLDAFARFRTEQGLPCCSVNWGAWSDVGAAAGFKNLESTFGMRMFTPAQGIAALQRAILTPAKTNSVVFDVADGKVLANAYNAGAYLDLLRCTRDDERGSSAELEARLQAVKEADPAEREGKIREFIEYVIRDTLRLPESEPIDPDQDIREMGIDSLMAMEMRSKIQHLLEGYDTHALSLHDLQDNRTVNKLARLINDTVNKGVAARKLTPEELLELVKKDCVLPEDILEVKFEEEGQFECPKASVLLTGATGHLAPYILQELVAKSSDGVVFCLIRAKTDEDARDRLETVLDDLALLESLTPHLHRVHCIAGNVASPSFGLTPERYAALTLEVDSVIHCAALANPALPYGPFSGDDVRTNNVIGLLNVLRFCCSGGRPKALQFESSIYALSRLQPDGSLPDDFPSDEDWGESLKTGYHISKFVCEKLLKQAIARGLPAETTVLRHHYLIGDSRTGLIPMRRNNLSMFMLTCQKIGKFPEVDEAAMITAVPVDVAANVSVQLFLDSKVEPGVYNVNNPKLRRLHDLEDVIRSRGFEFEVVPYNKWREAALASQGIEMAPLAELYMKDLFSSDMITQHTLLKNALEGHGLSMVSNSTRIKACIHDIDEQMVDPVDMCRLQLDYYEQMFGKGNMKAFFEAAGK